MISDIIVKASRSRKDLQNLLEKVFFHFCRIFRYGPKFRCFSLVKNSNCLLTSTFYAKFWKYLDKIFSSISWQSHTSISKTVMGFESWHILYTLHIGLKCPILLFFTNRYNIYEYKHIHQPSILYYIFRFKDNIYASTSSKC